MQRVMFSAVPLAFAAAMSLSAQSSHQSTPWVSVGGGWAVTFAQDQAYTSSPANVEQIALGWKLRQMRLTTEAVFVQSRFGDAESCVPRLQGGVRVICPQIYDLVGGAILFPAEQPAADGIPQRFAFSGGLGVYSVRPPKTGSRLAPALQVDLDMALVRRPPMDILLGVKAIAMPKVRGDFLFAMPLTMGFRFW
jgi:hypothetical protein